MAPKRKLPAAAGNMDIAVMLKKTVKCLSDAVSVLTGMPPELRGEYSEVKKLVRLLLVSPTSFAEAE
jgi:hypothetical protein